MIPAPNRWQHLEPFVRKLFQERIEKYDQIMVMTHDVAMIAQTYQLPMEVVQRAKDYAFGWGVTQYQLYPDLDMANAWLRLAKNQGTWIDKVLLDHEIYESNLVINQGLSQTEAHDLTQLKFPWSVLVRESQNEQ